MHQPCKTFLHMYPIKLHHHYITFIVPKITHIDWIHVYKNIYTVKVKINE